jgi:hypothetical protein
MPPRGDGTSPVACRPGGSASHGRPRRPLAAPSDDGWAGSNATAAPERVAPHGRTMTDSRRRWHRHRTRAPTSQQAGDRIGRLVSIGVTGCRISVWPAPLRRARHGTGSLPGRDRGGRRRGRPDERHRAGHLRPRRLVPWTSACPHDAAGDRRVRDAWHPVAVLRERSASRSVLAGLDADEPSASAPVAGSSVRGRAAGRRRARAARAAATPGRAGGIESGFAGR